MWGFNAGPLDKEAVRALPRARGKDSGALSLRSSYHWSNIRYPLAPVGTGHAEVDRRFKFDPAECCGRGCRHVGQSRRFHLAGGRSHRCRVLEYTPALLCPLCGRPRFSRVHAGCPPPREVCCARPAWTLAELLLFVGRERPPHPPGNVVHFLLWGGGCRACDAALARALEDGMTKKIQSTE